MLLLWGMVRVEKVVPKIDWKYVASLYNRIILIT